MFDFVVYDFDGVLTDNKVLIAENGKEIVICNRDDGWAVRKIKELGIPQMILSSEQGDVVRQRASKLSLLCVIGCNDKKKRLLDLCAAKGYDLKKVLYVGNGLNDLEVMKSIGHPIAPNDAHPDVKNIVGVYVTQKNGGEGVLLEVLDYIKERVQ